MGFSSRRGATGSAREPRRVGRSKSANIGISLEGRCEAGPPWEASLAFLGERMLLPPDPRRSLRYQSSQQASCKAC